MPEIQVIPSPPQLTSVIMETDAKEYEKYTRSIIPKLRKRSVLYAILAKLAKKYKVSIDEVIGPELAQEHQNLNKATKKFAKMVSGLNDETLSLIWWTGTEEVQTPKAILAVIESNRAEQYLSGPLWPIIPVLLKVAVVTGVFWLTNAWLSTQQLEAENDSVAVRTDAKLAEAVELLSKTSPKNAAILAKAIGKARKAADKMDDGTFIDKAKKGIKSLGTGVGIGIGGGVIALIAALAFGGKKRR